MKMKKLALSMAVAASMGATAANAAVVSEYSVGLLVPNVIHSGPNDTTGVGIVSRHKGTVYWTFFDENSNHITNGEFPVTANDYHAFLWSDPENSGVGLDAKRGYLVFVADVSSGTAPPNCDDTETDGVITECDARLNPIAGAAAQFLLASQDAAFMPVIPLANFDLEDFPVTPTDLGPGDVDYLVAGANCVASGQQAGGRVGTLVESIKGPYRDDIDIRYFIDGKPGGQGTNVVIWSAQNVQGTHTVNMFDDKQNRKSVNFTLPNRELNFLDVESIAGRPEGFTDGFIRWDVPCGRLVSPLAGLKAGDPAPWNGIITYSEIKDPGVGAVQTIINPFGPNVSP